MKRALVRVHLRLGMYGSLAWAGGLIIYTAAIVWIYPTVAEVEGMGEYLDQMPEQFRELAGIADLKEALDEHGFFTLEGFISTEYMTWLPILLGIYAIMSGSSLVAREVERGSLDIILGQPVHRYGYLVTRALTQMAVLLALVLVSFTTLWIGILFLDESVSILNLLYAHAVAYGLIVSLFTFAVLWSAVFLRTSRATAVAGLATVLAYVIKVLAPSLGPVGWLEKLSPFTYYESLPLLNTGEVDPVSIIVYAGISLVSMGTAIRVFERRDLVS